jgi:hypothetical protein
MSRRDRYGGRSGLLGPEGSLGMLGCGDGPNEKLLDICVDFSTKDGQGKYQKPHGVGDQDEVYRHFLRLQLRKLNEGEPTEEEKDADLEQGGNIQT